MRPEYVSADVCQDVYYKILSKVVPALLYCRFMHFLLRDSHVLGLMRTEQGSEMA
jgi:hypothetical protein